MNYSVLIWKCKIWLFDLVNCLCRMEDILIYDVVLQVIRITDIIRPPEKDKFKDVYIVYELMETDLHQIICSSQKLTEDHCQVSLMLSILSHQL